MAKVPRNETSNRIDPRATPILVVVALFAMANSTPPARGASLVDAESRACQDCHAISDWQINDPVTGRVAHLSIDTEAYSESSHRFVPCRSCHGWGYNEIPHRGSSQHPIYECVFCHDKDPAVEHFQLSQRKLGLQGSVHGNTESGPLDCHTCHDPHTFRPVNDSDDPLVRIAQSNAICLRCHGPATESRNPFARDDTTSQHAEIPNYANHLRKVKCVVCHTARDADAAGSRHEVLVAERSLRECEQCHTPSSAILDAIYGPQRLGTDAPEAGMPGAQVGGEVDVAGGAYVIGSTRSPQLERLSFVVFAAVCLAIGLHGFARAVHALRNAKGRSNDV